MTSNKFLYLKCHFTLLSSLYRMAHRMHRIVNSCVLCVDVCFKQHDDAHRQDKYFMTNILLLYKEFYKCIFIIIIQFSLARSFVCVCVFVGSSEFVGAF